MLIGDDQILDANVWASPKRWHIIHDTHGFQVNADINNKKGVSNKYLFL